MKTTPQNTRALHESQLKTIFNACLNERNPQFEYVSGILVGMGYDTMAEFVETMNKEFGFSYEINTIATLYYFADLDDRAKLSLQRIARKWFEEKNKEE